MAQGDGSYNNPIIVDGLIKKNGKFYKLNTGDAKSDVSQKYLPLTGGAVGTTYVDRGTNISQFNRKDGNGEFIICGGTSVYDGGALYLNSVNQQYKEKGAVEIYTINPFNQSLFQLKISGINRSLTTSDGSIPIIDNLKTTPLTHAFTFKNGVKIQCIRLPMSQKKGYQAVNWVFPFSDTNYHVFVMSEDSDTNLEFQIASVTLLNKSTTTCYVAHKVENIENFFEGQSVSVMGIGI